MDPPALFFAHGDRLTRAGLSATPAGNALDIPHHELREQFLRFGIRAPGTFQRAAFHKYRGPDSRSVVYAESLDVEDNTLLRFFSPGWHGNLPEALFGSGDD